MKILLDLTIEEQDKQRWQEEIEEEWKNSLDYWSKRKHLSVATYNSLPADSEIPAGAWNKTETLWIKWGWQLGN